MKKPLFFCCTVIALSLLSFTNSTELPIGAAMPKADIKMKDVSGEEVTLKEAFRDNGLLVMFSCNTCPYVIKNQHRTREICNYAMKHNIGVILINSNEAKRNDDDSYPAMKDYAKAQQYNWYYAMDSHTELADAFGAKRTPENYLFNKDGKLVYHGAIDNNPSDENNVTRKHLKEAVDEMLNGKEVTVKISRSVGCSIRRI